MLSQPADSARETADVKELATSHPSLALDMRAFTIPKDREARGVATATPMIDQLSGSGSAEVESSCRIGQVKPKAWLGLQDVCLSSVTWLSAGGLSSLPAIDRGPQFLPHESLHETFESPQDVAAGFHLSK